MCIICTCSIHGKVKNMDGAKIAADFLNKYDVAMQSLKSAEKAILLCAKIVPYYGTIHKKMVKIRKQYAQIERLREDDKLTSSYLDKREKYYKMK